MSEFVEMANEFLKQDRIAVAGVSRDPQQTANFIYRKLRSEGYQVYALNPNAGTVEDDPCYPDVGTIPEKVDGVIIVTRPDLSTRIVRDCIQAGVPRVWMHNNSIGPSSVSQEGVELCRQAGVQVIAGGCPMMFLDFGHKCMRLMLGMMRRLPA